MQIQNDHDTTIQQHETLPIPITAYTPMPLSNRAVAFASGAIAAGGLLEMAGAGIYGLIVAGVVGSAVAYFSPEIRGMMRDILPSSRPRTEEHRRWNWHMLLASNYEPEPHTEPELVTLSLKAPIIESNVEPHTTAHETAYLEDLVHIARPAPMRQPAQPQNMLLWLADNYQPHVNEILGKGLVGFGISGSGKTNLAALLIEQLGKFSIPALLNDLEGDYESLIDVLPRGRRAGNIAEPGGIFASIENAEPIGQYIMEHGIQLVLDLRSYPSNDEAAQVMCGIVRGITAWSNAQHPAQRVPCIILLDEAQHFLPQDASISTLSKPILKEVQQTFIETATRGRKRGLTPIIFAQRISDLDKRVIAQSNVGFFGKQRNDNDLERYEGIIRASVAKADTIASFQSGQFVVWTDTGEQFITCFHKRQSEHVSHTPQAEAAIARYQSQRQPQSQSQPAPAMEPLPMRESGEPFTSVLPSVSFAPVQPLRVPVTPKPQRDAELERALAAWNDGHTSINKLQKALKVTHHRAYKLHQQLKACRMI